MGVKWWSGRPSTPCFLGPSELSSAARTVGRRGRQQVGLAHRPGLGGGPPGPRKAPTEEPWWSGQHERRERLPRRAIANAPCAMIRTSPPGAGVAPAGGVDDPGRDLAQSLGLALSTIEGELVAAARVFEPREGFAGASPYEIAPRYAAGS